MSRPRDGGDEVLDDGALGYAGNSAGAVGSFLGMQRSRNGRLGLDRLSRRLVARWRALRLDGEWYDRRRARTRGLTRVPHSRRPLTPGELRALADDNPWRLS